jgi:hypothetical protein
MVNHVEMCFAIFRVFFRSEGNSVGHVVCKNALIWGEFRTYKDSGDSTVAVKKYFAFSCVIEDILYLGIGNHYGQGLVVEVHALGTINTIKCACCDRQNLCEEPYLERSIKLLCLPTRLNLKNVLLSQTKNSQKFYPTILSSDETKNYFLV